MVKWTPCSPGDPAAVEKSWNDVGEKELQEPPLVVSSSQMSFETLQWFRKSKFSR